MAFAWMIIEDIIADSEDPCYGVMNGRGDPQDVAGKIEAIEDDGEGYAFRLFDDDGVEYYRGRLLADVYDEEACWAPLRWGMRHAGCTSVRYPDHPEWDCG